MRQPTTRAGSPLSRDVCRNLEEIPLRLIDEPRIFVAQQTQKDLLRYVVHVGGTADTPARQIPTQRLLPVAIPIRKTFCPCAATCQFPPHRRQSSSTIRETGSEVEANPRLNSIVITHHAKLITPAPAPGPPGGGPVLTCTA